MSEEKIINQQNNQQIKKNEEKNVKDTTLANSQKNEVNIKKNVVKNNNKILSSPPSLKKKYTYKDIIWEDLEAKFSPVNGIFFFIRFLTLDIENKNTIKYNDFYYELAENIPFTFLENLKIKDMGILQGSITLTGDSYILENMIIKFMSAYNYYCELEETKQKIVTAPHFLLKFGWIGTNNYEYAMQENEWLECNLMGTIPQLQYTENNTVSVTLNFYSTNANYMKLELYCKNDNIIKKGNITNIFENIFLLKTNKDNPKIEKELENLYKENKIIFYIDDEVFNDMKKFLDGEKYKYNYTKTDKNVTFINWSLKKALENEKIQHSIINLLENMISQFPKLLVSTEKQVKENNKIKTVIETLEYNWGYKAIPFSKNLDGTDIWTAIIIYNEYRKEYVPPELENKVSFNKVKGYRFTNTSSSLLLSFNVDLSNIFYQYLGNQFAEINRENILTTTKLKTEKSESDLLAFIKLKKDILPPFLTGSITVIGSLFWLSFFRKVAKCYEVYNTPIYVDIKDRFNKKSIVSLFYIATTTEHTISANNWTVTINLLSDTTKPFDLEE